jgi:hypothetical protein
MKRRTFLGGTVAAATCVPFAATANINLFDMTPKTGFLFVYDTYQHFEKSCAGLRLSPVLKEYVENNYNVRSDGKIQVTLDSKNKEIVDKMGMLSFPSALTYGASYIENLDTGVVFKDRYQYHNK